MDVCGECAVLMWMKLCSGIGAAFHKFDKSLSRPSAGEDTLLEGRLLKSLVLLYTLAQN